MANRIEGMMDTLKPCSKSIYYKTEILKELTALMQVMVKKTYNEEHAENMQLGMKDVIRHFQEKNVEYGGIASEPLRRFERACSEFDTLLGRERAGTMGETLAFRSLETVRTEKIEFHNVELHKGENRGELDAVVVTAKAIFLIEVKNSGHDMEIDSRGNYYRSHGYMNLDYNIGEKVNNKEFLLRDALLELSNTQQKEFNIVNLVVFANSRINVNNRFKYLETCFLSQLPHIIDDYAGEDIYLQEDMKNIEKTIKEAECKRAYPLNFDVSQFKLDFATILCILETASEPEAVSEKEEMIKSKEKVMGKTICDLRSKIMQQTHMKYVGVTAAALVLTVITTAVLTKK